MWCHYADFSHAAFQLFTLDVGRALGLEDLEFSLFSCRDRDDEARGTFVGAPRVGN